MKTMLLPSLVFLTLGLATASAAHPAMPGALPRSTPERQGISSPAILEFVDAADSQVDSLHSFMLVRHGQVVAEGWWNPYDARTPHELYSLSKSFTSTAVGLAIAEGRMSLDDSVLAAFPGDAPPEPSDNLKAMRVRDLLRMSAGHASESPTARDQISAKAFLAQPVPFKPGTRFLYNTPATFLLSAMVQKATGQTVRDYLMPRLFEPLGIDAPKWETNFQGISLGGYGLSVRTEDIARFGQLFLQQGRWRGRQVVPSAWVDAATALQTSNGSNPNSDWDQGYGYQFWRCRHHAYRGDGAFGQFCIVMPDQDAVIALTSGVRDMQAVMNLVWDKLLPGMQERRLPARREAQQKLVERLAHLTLRPPSGAATTSLADRVRGKRFAFPPNDQHLEWLELDLGSNGEVTLVAQVNGQLERIASGQGEWKKGQWALGPLPAQPAAVSGAWVADDTYVARICYYQTPFCLTLHLQFTQDQLRHDSEFNVSFGPRQQPQLIGHPVPR